MDVDCPASLAFITDASNSLDDRCTKATKLASRCAHLLDGKDYVDDELPLIVNALTSTDNPRLRCILSSAGFQLCGYYWMDALAGQLLTTVVAVLNDAQAGVVAHGCALQALNDALCACGEDDCVYEEDERAAFVARGLRGENQPVAAEASEEANLGTIGECARRFASSNSESVVAAALKLSGFAFDFDTVRASLRSTLHNTNPLLEQLSAALRALCSVLSAAAFGELEINAPTADDLSQVVADCVQALQLDDIDGKSFHHRNAATRALAFALFMQGQEATAPDHVKALAEAWFAHRFDDENGPGGAGFELAETFVRGVAEAHPTVWSGVAGDRQGVDLWCCAQAGPQV